MFSGNYTPSVADIAAVTNGNCGNGYGYGGDWWAWIIIMALFGCNCGNTCGTCC